ncbi:DNA topoisomerase III [Salmonella enterica]|nr:DNA topoisomerase III [Salmonella enterica]
MRVFIAEKPSVAKAIAAVLGATNKKDGYIECGSDYITWCFGHMYEQAEPDEYTPDNIPRNESGKKIWREEDLPIIPDKWIIRPREDAEKQLKTITHLIERADTIINAGDPDREGQLLVDEILDEVGCKKPVLRYWCNAYDTVSVTRALNALESNDKYVNWGRAALARGRVDWLVGMNFSRGFTLKAARGGSRVLLTVGRVQTPTLALVVARDLEIENFKPVPYHNIRAVIKHGDSAFVAAWKASEDQAGLDSEGRLVDTKEADRLVSELTNSEGKVVEYKQEPKKQNQPKSYSLSDLVAQASSSYGYTAEQVLATCQSLYETHKLTSYPRSDCSYLPESQHSDAPEIFKSLKKTYPDIAVLIDNADPKIKSKTFDDSKVTAHHGIIPTQHTGDVNKLSAMEKNIYDLIVRAYLAQFYPAHEFKATTIVLDIKGETFAAGGKVVTKNGWKDIYTAAEEEDDGEKEAEQKLPVMKNGDSVLCAQAKRMDAKTKAPRRFNDGTLNTAMVNIHKYVDDPAQKKLLREGDGIGTEATRATIVAELKKRGFITNKGKDIISTPLGRGLIQILPDLVKSPVMTAINERMLLEIAQGKRDVDSFVKMQEKFVRDQVQIINTGSIKVAGGVQISDKYKCKVCGKGLIRRASKKSGHFWSCSGYPTCKESYPDIKGSPNYNPVKRA